mgnify:CR=1 FL=1
MRLRWGLWLQLCQTRFAGHKCLLWYSTMNVSLGSASQYPEDCVVIVLSLRFMFLHIDYLECPYHSFFSVARSAMTGPSLVRPHLESLVFNGLYAISITQLVD